MSKRQNRCKRDLGIAALSLMLTALLASPGLASDRKIQLAVCRSGLDFASAKVVNRDGEAAIQLVSTPNTDAGFTIQNLGEGGIPSAQLTDKPTTMVFHFRKRPENTDLVVLVEWKDKNKRTRETQIRFGPDRSQIPLTPFASRDTLATITKDCLLFNRIDPSESITKFTFDCRCLSSGETASVVTLSKVTFAGELLPTITGANLGCSAF